MTEDRTYFQGYCSGGHGYRAVSTYGSYQFCAKCWPHRVRLAAELDRAGKRKRGKRKEVSLSRS